MPDRKGEKIGWVAGWSGGFIWVVILAIVFLARGKNAEGITGIILAGAAIALVLAYAPWRHPDTAYWKLMLAPLAMFAASIAWAVWIFGGLRAAGIDWWSFFILMPFLLPFGSVGRRIWCDVDAKTDSKLTMLK